MFRSLFARMLITISMVLTVSFLILSAVLANYSNQYEVEKRAAQLERTAAAAAALLEVNRRNQFSFFRRCFYLFSTNRLSNQKMIEVFHHKLLAKSSTFFAYVARLKFYLKRLLHHLCNH